MNVGIIGGSGFYQLPGSEVVEKLQMTTPLGEPSSPISKITKDKNTFFFLARHGEHHQFSPSEINYRANIFAMKQLGVTNVVSIGAVGSLRKEIRPGDFVFPDQYIDFTKGYRKNSFLGEGIVGHAQFANPSCSTTRRFWLTKATQLGIRVHEGGTYICMEGPQFSTRAESQWYRSFSSHVGKADIIGMTAMPEAKLAREAGLCYQTIGMVTDYDCWDEEKGELSMTALRDMLQQNMGYAKQLVEKILSDSPQSCKICKEEVKHMILTAREHWPASRLEVMETILK